MNFFVEFFYERLCRGALQGLYTEGDTKFQNNIFIHYQDIEILFVFVFLTVQLYFATKCFQNFTD